MAEIKDVITQMVQAGEPDTKIAAVINAHKQQKAQEQEAARKKAYYDELYRRNQEEAKLKKEQASQDDATAEQKSMASTSDDGLSELLPTNEHIPLENFQNDGGFLGVNVEYPVVKALEEHYSNMPGFTFDSSVFDGGNSVQITPPGTTESRTFNLPTNTSDKEGWAAIHGEITSFMDDATNANTETYDEGYNEVMANSKTFDPNAEQETEADGNVDAYFKDKGEKGEETTLEAAKDIVSGTVGSYFTLDYWKKGGPMNVVNQATATAAGKAKIDIAQDQAAKDAYNKLFKDAEENALTEHNNNLEEGEEPVVVKNEAM